MYFQMMHIYIFICCIIFCYIHNIFIHIELFQRFLLPSNHPDPELVQVLVAMVLCIAER